MTKMEISILPLAAYHRKDWERLYLGYAAFYKRPFTAEQLERLWGWLMDRAHPVEGLIAEDTDGRAIGLAHFRPYPRPLMAAEACFLDDLFVDPALRGTGAGAALLDRLKEIGRERGWAIIRWTTADDNYVARTLYDRRAKRTMWLTYEMETG